MVAFTCIWAMGCSASKREEDVRFTSPQDIAQPPSAAPAPLAAAETAAAVEPSLANATAPEANDEDAEKHAKALAALAALDEPLVGVLSSGDIRLQPAAG